MDSYVLYTDETNAEPDEAVEFFIYGGVWVRADRLPELDATVTDIRTQAGYESVDILKFDTRSRPASVTRAAHTKAKQAILEAAFGVDLRFTAVAVLHTIAQDREWRWKLQADEVLWAFERFLAQKNAVGFAIMDRTGEIFEYLIEKGQRGYVNRKNDTNKPMPHIHAFATGAIGSSHLASVADIVLGTLRYCINDKLDAPATRKMLPAVVRLMWYLRLNNGYTTVAGRGLILRPQLVSIKSHRKRYDDLTERLNRVLTETGAVVLRSDP